jgi:hypothetical protein
MRRSLTLIPLLVLALLSCTPKEEGKAEIRVAWVSEPTPPALAPTLFRITLTDAQGVPVEVPTIALEANMAHPGMVPVLAEATSVGNGQYEARLTPTMAGSWIMFLKIPLPSGTVAKEFTFEVNR